MTPQRRLSLVVATTAPLVFAMTVMPVQAQTFEPLRVSVPFLFVAGGETFPPGTYTLSALPSGNIGILAVQGAKRTGYAAVAPTPRPDSSAISGTRGDELLFILHDGRYVLAQVWEDGTALGEQVASPNSTAPSQHEKAGMESTVVLAAARPSIH